MKNIDLHSYYKSFVNVKYEFEHRYKTKAYGMRTMLDTLKLTLDGRHHSGIDDTKNIAKIMLKIINDGHKYNDYRHIHIKLEKDKKKDKKTKAIIKQNNEITK